MIMEKLALALLFLKNNLMMLKGKAIIKKLTRIS